MTTPYAPPQKELYEPLVSKQPTTELGETRKPGIQTGRNSHNEEMMNMVKHYEEVKSRHKMIIVILSCLLVMCFGVIIGLAIWGNHHAKKNQTASTTLSTSSGSTEKTFGNISVLQNGQNQNAVRAATGFLGISLNRSNVSAPPENDVIVRGKNYLGVMSYYEMGSITYKDARLGCDLLYEGYSEFTLRSLFGANASAVSGGDISVIRITSEQCDRVQKNISSNHTFTINGQNFLATCMPSLDQCKIFETMPIILNASDTAARRRLPQIHSCAVGTVYVQGKGSSDCVPTSFSTMQAVRTSLTVSTVPYKVVVRGFASLIHAFREAVSDCYFANHPDNPSCPVLRCCPNPCFPANARVQMKDRSTKSMKNLKVGDKVLSVNVQGEMEYSDVYMFGHKIPDMEMEFVHVTSVSGHEIVGTADHFLYVCANKDCVFGESAKLKRFGEVVVEKDYVILENREVSMVSGVERKMDIGLYNPYTLNGNVVVNGVVASCHSRWVLDDLVPFRRMEQFLPWMYQMMFAPIRLLYRVFPNLLTRFDGLHPMGAEFASVQSVLGTFKVHWMTAVSMGGMVL